MSRMFKTRKEKEFEFFVENLVKLEPIEFIGLAKILSVPLVRLDQVREIDLERAKEMSEEERKQLASDMTRPMDEVLSQMMDRFLDLPKHRRKEINDILKDVARTQKKVK